MNRRALQIALPILILGAGIYGGHWLVNNRKQIAPEPVKPFRPKIEYVTAQFQDYTPIIRSQGTVRPRGQTLVSPEVSGKILFVPDELVVGARVEKDFVLARIDDSDFQLALQAAEADIQSARTGVTNAMAQVSTSLASVAQAEARIAREQAEAEAAKAEWLLLGREGEPPPLLVRAPQLKEARAALTAAQANTAGAQAQIKSYQAAEAAAQAKADQARLNIERCIITAPYRSRISEVRADIGQIATPTQALAIIQHIDYAEVQLPLTLADVEWIDLPNSLKGGLQSTAGPDVKFSANGHSWGGKITRGEGAVDPATLTTALIGTVLTPYDASPIPLTFGRFVEAEIEGKILKDAVTLPAKSLREKSSVYLHVNGTLQRREVTVAYQTRSHIIITDGLKAGDQVCTTTLDTFVDGMAVETTMQQGAQADE